MQHPISGCWLFLHTSGVHMAAVVSLVVVISLGLLITRVATVALTMTGMSLDHARFQARSAFTGTGFTTSEAEAVVTHPARRRIVMSLMLVSGAGAISVLGALILSFAGVDTTAVGLTRAAVIVAALVMLLWLARNRHVDRALRRVIERALRRFTVLDVRDYAALLHLRGQWRVAQLPVAEDDWISSRPLGQLRLPDEGVAVLGVERAEGVWIGAPSEDIKLKVGDVVVLYGRAPILDDIAARIHGAEGDEASDRFRAWHAASPTSEPLSSVRRQG
ncbi:MAG: potassium transporter TrkA [Actinomycetota bacterium]|nr:potassium transporter TrkA [Actinomycetota bacterium]